MEKLRLIINRYVAEGGMAFSAAEFTAAVIVSICACAAFVAVCAI